MEDALRFVSDNANLFLVGVGCALMFFLWYVITRPIKGPMRVGEQFMTRDEIDKRRELQKALLADIITSGLEDAWTKDMISDADKQYWYRKLGAGPLQLTDLLPHMKYKIEYPKADAVKARIKADLKSGKYAKVKLPDVKPSTLSMVSFGKSKKAAA